jgi:hypothetical protein
MVRGINGRLREPGVSTSRRYIIRGQVSRPASREITRMAEDIPKDYME